MDENQETMAKILSYEAKALGRKMERKAKRLQAAAERALINHQVIETNDDDVRGDLCSLILNAKPPSWSEDAWLCELELRGAPRAKTMRRWLTLATKHPTSVSERLVLAALGLSIYYGKTA